MLETYVREALRRGGIRPTRARGQHFLIDDSVLASVIQAAQLDGTEHVVEIGPGLGTLTQSLAARCQRVDAFELDDELSRYLTTWVLPETRNVVLHDVAFNKYVFEPVIEVARKAGRPLKIVTNLPYQISSEFLHTVVDYRESLSLVVVMLQREVAQRVCAQPGERGFGSFSLYLQTYLATRHVCSAGPEAFYPPPRVHSGVIALTPLTSAQQPQPRDRELYLRVIETVFRHRRKTLLNALLLALPHLKADRLNAAIAAAGLDPQSRPQTLGMAEFVRLADAL